MHRSPAGSPAPTLPRIVRGAVALVPLTALLVLSAAAFAQEQGPPTAAAEAGGDPHRWALWTSCSVFFGAVVLFLVTTHRRSNAALGRIEAMEKRLSEAEKRL